MTTRLSFAARTLAVTLTAGAALGLAGCGNENTGPGFANSDTGGVTYADEALSKDDIMQVAYAAAMKAKTTHIDMKMSGKASLTAKGDVMYGARKPTMSMSMTMPQLGKGKIEMRFVGGILYMQIPQMTPPGKFLAIDPQDRTSPLAKSFAGTTDQMDPLKAIKAMESAVQSAERVGKQTLGGVTVEHYKLDVDTSALVKGMDPAVAKQANLPDTLTYDLWLDEQHRIRRTSFEMSGVNFEATMSKWGKPVKVQRPSADQIVGLPQA
jgi:hypothetical protein